MSLKAYLTSDFPDAGYICRRLLIPNDRGSLAVVTGALNELTFSYNFEKYGAMTPDETASMFQQMFDRFVFDSAGGCRMIGELIPYAGDTSPKTQWLLCDGSSLLIDDYPDLFAVCGTEYGSVDGDHFSIPDMRGRVPIGMGMGTGLPDFAVGEFGGEIDHTLDVGEMPSHSHTDTGHLHTEGIAVPSVAVVAPADGPSAVPGVGSTALGSASLTSTGGDDPHNNLQPYLTINWLIVALEG